MKKVLDEDRLIIYYEMMNEMEKRIRDIEELPLNHPLKNEQMNFLAGMREMLKEVYKVINFLESHRGEKHESKEELLPDEIRSDESSGYSNAARVAPHQKFNDKIVNDVLKNIPEKLLKERIRTPMSQKEHYINQSLKGYLESQIKCILENTIGKEE